VVSGVGAVLEELNDARRGEAPDPATPTTNDRPVRIELE
jgi:hypothetical protein